MLLRVSAMNHEHTWNAPPSETVALFPSTIALIITGNWLEEYSATAPPEYQQS